VFASAVLFLWFFYNDRKNVLFDISKPNNWFWCMYYTTKRGSFPEFLVKKEKRLCGILVSDIFVTFVLRVLLSWPEKIRLRSF